MDIKTNINKFTGWATALIIVSGIISLALAAGLVCGVLYVADNYMTSHARIGESSYWMEKSRAMLKDDERLLSIAKDTMEQGGISSVAQMDPDDGMPGDTMLRGKRYTYRVAYSDRSAYTAQAYTMLGIMDTLYEKYGIVHIDMENGMIRYEFTRNNDLFKKTEDSLCYPMGGAAPANTQTDSILDTYTPVQDGWYLRTYREGITIERIRHFE